MKGKTNFLETKFSVSLSYEVWGLRRLWVTVSTALVARTTLLIGLPAQGLKHFSQKPPGFVLAGRRPAGSKGVDNDSIRSPVFRSFVVPSSAVSKGADNDGICKPLVLRWSKVAPQNGACAKDDICTRAACP
jgi:hypothetical protein